MAITKPKTRSSENSVNSFISSAPDAPHKGVRKGKKNQISLTISPELLSKVDAMASHLGQSRASIINMAIYRAVEHGLTIDGLKAVD